MVGYGQVWLPEAYQVSLRPFSYLLLGLNALFAFIWARRLAVRSIPASYGSLLIGGVHRRNEPRRAERNIELQLSEVKSLDVDKLHGSDFSDALASRLVFSQRHA